ncbi:helix-turn-helix domain-containing protein [Phycisphaera mikurensis]|nr:helix-turn-helix domain-containing protein [Phycisphaera mikurensis]
MLATPDDPKAAPPEAVLVPITLRAKQAAAVLCLSERTVKELAAAGTLPSFKLGTCRLFNRAELQRWADARQAEAAAPLAEGGAH